MRFIFPSLITPPNAAGIKTSHLTSSTSAEPMRSSAGTSSRDLCAKIAFISKPFKSTMPPETSEIAITFMPSSWHTNAAYLPTFPKPWIATVAPSTLTLFFSKVAAAIRATPRPVASSRPGAPNSSTGFPVTHAG